LNSSRSTVPALGSSSELRQTLSGEFPDLSYMVILSELLGNPDAFFVLRGSPNCQCGLTKRH